MKLAFSIALRFLSFSKLQTLVIIIGIAVGVSVQVFIGSLIGGLQKSLVDKTIGNSSQITIKPADKNNLIDDYQQKITQIKLSSSDLTIVVPVFDLGGGSITQNTISESFLLRGFAIDEADQLYQFSTKLTEGRLPQANNEVIIGIGLQNIFNLTNNNALVVNFPGSGDTTFTIVGFFDFNVAAVNQSWIVSNLATAQNIHTSGNKVTSIEMQVKDVFAADLIAPLVLDATSDSTLLVENWKDQNAELLSGLQGQSISSIMIQVFVMVSVVLAIASVLAITVMQKSKQIGILKAMGIKNRDASLIFLSEGFILGVFGALGGVLLGLGLSLAFTTFAIGEDGNPVVPLFIDYGFIALSATIALAASTLAALIPARKSSKLTVIEVIRNG